MGVKIGSLRLTEESRLRVFETRVLRKIFGPERDEVMEEWRILRNEELRDLYSFPNTIRTIKSRIMNRAGQEAHMVENKDMYTRLW